MDLTIHPGKLRGEITVIPSKSQAHRLLICAAFADKPTTIICPETNRDIQATVQCLNACGASILSTANGFTVTPAREIPAQAVLPCQDSGSTLRFLLPVATILANVLIVPFVLQYAYRVPDAWWFLCLTVGIGEVLAAGVGGVLMTFLLEKYRSVLFR